MFRLLTRCLPCSHPPTLSETMQTTSLVLTGSALLVEDVDIQVVATIAQKEDPAHLGNTKGACAPNIVEISVMSTSTIKSSCNGAIGHLVVSGILGPSPRGAAGPERGSLTLTNSAGGTFVSSATWDQSAGTITFWLENDMIAGVTYAFSFLVVHSQVTFAGHRDISLTMPQIPTKKFALDGAVCHRVAMCKADPNVDPVTWHNILRAFCNSSTYQHPHPSSPTLPLQGWGII